MSARAPANGERHPAAPVPVPAPAQAFGGDGGGARRVSPSMTAAAAADTAVPSSVAVRRCPRRERSPSPLTEGSCRTEPAQKKAKTTGEISKEVQDLLERNLMGDANAAAKVRTMRALREHFKTAAGESPQERQQKKEYCRAVEEWNGCHVVLAALRRELDKAGNAGGTAVPDRDVALLALLFLYRWNGSATRRGAMSRFRGAETVARAMRAFQNDWPVEDAAILCLSSFTGDGSAARRRELVEGGLIPLLFHAVLVPSSPMQRTPRNAVVLLGRLCDVAESRYFDGLVEKGALEAVAKVVKETRNSGEPGRERVLEACRKLMAKLIK